MSTSSSIPILGDVLFYTAGDTYNFKTDNRPLHNLDTNIRHIASSLVGIGYGEHASVDGSLLRPGKAVELLSTGLVRYPVIKSDVAILGLVIGSTEAGLNRVIWSSDHLDLDSVGLYNEILINSGGIIPEVESNLVVKCSTDVNQAGIVTVAVEPADDQIIIGKVKSYPIITVSQVSVGSQTSSFASASQVIANHHNLYGFSRVRNLLLSIDLGQTPMQYTKSTFYQDDLGPSLVNIMSAKLDSTKQEIIPWDGDDITYDWNVMGSKIVKEIYEPFTNGKSEADGGDGSILDSPWVNSVYQATLSDSGTSYINYDLAQSQNSPDFSSSQPLLNQFKNFKIEKYFQYEKQPIANNQLHGKLLVTATVFNPENTDWLSGEPGRLIIWDFYENSQVTGREKKKYRIISTGLSANLFNNPLIFPSELRNLL